MGEESNFDLKLIPEFDGSGTQSVVEWLEKLELVCALRKIKDVASVLPLRLTRGAFAVYLQLPEKDRTSTDRIKEALKAVFVVDPYEAYEQFISRKLRPNEAPDVYLAELRRLASLFGGTTDKALACAFVAGLPDNIRQLLRAGSRMEELTLDQILARARAVLRDDGPLLGTSAASFGVITQPGSVVCATAAESRRCYACGGINHLAKDCLARQITHAGAGEPARGGGGRPRRRMRCYRCGGVGHIATRCPGNEQGEGASAPAFSQEDQ